MADIFISYKREDRVWAKALSKALQAQGWSVWWDTRLAAGESFDDVIEHELNQARCVVVLWSKASKKSHWVKTEAMVGLRRKILAPVLIEKVEQPLAFTLIHAADLSRWNKKETDVLFVELVKDISKILGPAPAMQRKAEPVAKKKKGFNWTINWTQVAGRSTVGSVLGMLSVILLAVFLLWEPLGFNIGPTDGATDPLVGNQGTDPDSIAIPLPEVSFSANESSIVNGESTTLNWTATHATEVRIVPDVGAVDTTGSQNVMPNNTTTYRLIARGPGGEVDETLTIRVTEPPQIPTPIALFVADPDEIERGQSTTLNWSTSNASTVRIDQGIGEVAANGSRSVRPRSTTTFTLTATGGGTTTTKRVQVTVNEPPRVAEPFTNSIGMEFVQIKANTFRMGSASSQWDFEKPVHTVRITQDFYMGVTEVTQGQWQQVMNENPSRLKEGDDHPIETVSWDRVQEFIQEMNRRDREYRYRLPTEAEWEFACRAGSTTEYYYGDDASLLDQYAVYGGGSKHMPVKSKRPNAWGLYDMMGNVWEWTADWYGADYYGSSPQADPKGPAQGNRRVLRGGSFVNDDSRVRCATRDGDSPGAHYSGVGFRLVALPRSD